MNRLSFYRGNSWSLVLLLVVLRIAATGCSSSLDQPVANQHPASIPQLTKWDIEGVCVGIKDGDTIVVLTTEKEEKTIRLASIDCPELKGRQPFARRARELTSDLCFAKNVRIRSTGQHFERIVGFVEADGRNINEELVRAGLAWHATDFSDDPKLDSLEKKARGLHLGLWSQARPVNPKYWRRGAKG